MIAPGDLTRQTKLGRPCAAPGIWLRARRGSGACFSAIAVREASQEMRAWSLGPVIACRSSPNRPNGRPGRRHRGGVARGAFPSLSHQLGRLSDPGSGWEDDLQLKDTNRLRDVYVTVCLHKRRRQVLPLRRGLCMMRDDHRLDRGPRLARMTTSTSCGSVVDRVRRWLVTLPFSRASRRSSKTLFQESKSRTRWRSESTNTVPES
jgi:hypothetical protein